jgi:hypothetical protein
MKYSYKYDTESVFMRYLKNSLLEIMGKFTEDKNL